MGLVANDIADYIHLPSMDILLDNKGILHVKYLEGKTIDVKEKMEEQFAIWKITEGKKRPVLFSMENFVSVTREAKEYSVEIELEQPFVCVAVLVENYTYKLLAEFYIKMYKPKLLYNIFKTYDNAIEWLLAHKEHSEDKIAAIEKLKPEKHYLFDVETWS